MSRDLVPKKTPLYNNHQQLVFVSAYFPENTEEKHHPMKYRRLYTATTPEHHSLLASDANTHNEVWEARIQTEGVSTF